jgi:eukaryotic-like serine/threonine-protein kinase
MSARYELFGPVAAGGMATVHFGRVRGGAGFSRIVAIKRLHRELAQVPEIAASLVDEARLVSRIHHPNVVPILDVVDHEGELWLVMEYVAGESLAGIIAGALRAGQRLPPAVASAIVGEVLRGLHAAHTALSEQGEPLGIVHRDVSPQNVLVGADGLARLVDFGVAKARSRITSTRAGELKGKLGYMAPEQILAGDVGPASDVFATAIVLWEALAGARLFSGDNEGQVVLKVVEAKVVPPSASGAPISAALDGVVMRGLARDPAERFRSAAEFANELARVEPPAPPQVVAGWVQRAAGSRLAERAARVAEIERAVQAPPVPAVRKAAPAFALADEATQDDAPIFAAPATAVGTAATVPPIARRRARWPWLIAALAVGATAASGLAFLRASTAPEAVSVAPLVSAPATTAATAGAATTAAKSAAPAPSEDREPAAPRASAEAPPPAPRRAAVNAPAAARTARPARPAIATAAAACNPPFTVDADGIQHLKPECAR